MTYTVLWTEKAAKSLRRLPEEQVARIIDAVERIRERPFDHVRWLTGSPYFRYRVGKYRIILDIKHKTLIIYVIKVGNRENVYDDL